jgi:High-temperature-induced dauer-formation protein
MHDTATHHKTITEDGQRKTLRGCINLLIRTFPILFEDKDLLLRCMWREQALFNNQINAIKMMESISVLLFKPGFSIQEVPESTQVNEFVIDENLVWKAGVSVMEAPNTYNKNYN